MQFLKGHSIDGSAVYLINEQARHVEGGRI